MKLVNRSDMEKNATTIPYDSVVTGSLIWLDLHVYKFTGNLGDIVSIRMSTGGFNAQIKLYGPDGILLNEASWKYMDDYVSIMDYPLPASGVFTVYCKDDDQEDTGSYQMIVKKIL
jgi:hypothetical protein